DLLDIDHPIIQAPMAGASTPEMAAAAANAGALGSLGCAFLTGNQLREEMHLVQASTNRSINLNFFVHKPPGDDPVRADTAQAHLAVWYDRLDAGAMPDVTASHDPFGAATCDMVLELSQKVASFHFGLPDQVQVDALKDAGIVILSSATSADEARWLEDRGADAVIAQGYEAGGHSGWFLPRGPANTAGTMALVPRLVDAVSVPVIAAGGIGDGRGIAAALMLGAAGVQIGTALLASPESAVSAVHKQTLMSASGDDTMLSKAFSGRHARTVVNDYATEMDQVSDWPDFPLMNTLTGPLRGASARQGRPDAVSLWSGQAVGLIQQAGTADLINDLVAQTHKVLNQPRHR
ncbi:MAG: NAD(P)H-dependent flavin oxidoreductase, partial [Aestuariivirgaceae bacterium]